MRTRKARNYKFLIQIGIGLVVVLSLPIIYFWGSAYESLLIGPVSIWRATWTIPSSHELAGIYRPIDDQTRIGADTQVSLDEDGQVEIQDLPNFKDSTYAFDCVFNGTGHWRAAQSGGVIELTVDFDIAKPLAHGGEVCTTSFSLGGIQLQGHSHPYMLYLYAGDPDEWTGLHLKQQ